MWRNLHKFLDIFKLTIEKKEDKNLGKTFFLMCSQIYEKNVYLFTKLLLEKSAKLRKIKTMKALTFFGGFWGQNQIIV